MWLAVKTVLFALLQLSAAHFILQYPMSLGFDDDIEGTSPCGGFPVVFKSDDTNLQIGQFAMSMLSTHPEAEWLFRATLSQKPPFNWTNIEPVIKEMGLGHICFNHFFLPSEWAGQKGLVQAIQNAADGILYQCAAVNFVSGSNTTVGPTCTNATGVTATITNQMDFSTTSASANMATASGMSTFLKAPGLVQSTFWGLVVAIFFV